MEIQTHAKMIGLNIEEDKHLMYIAVDALKAPLPSPWRACKKDDGPIQFYNPMRNFIQMDRPVDQYYLTYL